MSDPLQERFEALCLKIGVREAQEITYALLKTKYSEAGRAYHNLKHIEHCLNEFDAVRQLAEHPDAIEVALWFHDVVYDSKAKDNEEKSASVLEAILNSADLPKKFIQRCESLVLITKHDKLPGATDEQLIVDIDLAILGQTAEIFDRYEAQIREEYSWVPNDAFTEGRSKILRQFLQRPSIYSTEHFRRKYEQAARDNLTRSLSRLQSS